MRKINVERATVYQISIEAYIARKTETKINSKAEIP